MSGIRTPGVERVHDPVALPAEDELDRSLRPRTLDDFVGQERVKDQLAVFIEAARARGEALDHVLLAGPPGLGKTSLAQIVAAELGVEFVPTAGPALERKGDVASYLTALELALGLLRGRDPPAAARARGDLLSRDGGPQAADHGRPGRGRARGHARPARVHAVGATTRTGLLTTPLRDRFGVTHRLELYEPAELGRIVRRSAGILDVDDRRRGRRDDRRPLARHAARGQPAAQAGARLRRGARRRRDRRDAWRREALDLLEVDAAGLDRLDREILRAICEKFGGGPVGLSTLRVAVGEEPDTIEDVYEPYLLQQGFLMRTPRGRVATEAAYGHLGLEPPRDGAARLF